MKKSSIYCMIVILGLLVAFPAIAAQDSQGGMSGSDLDSLSAVEAMAVANEWKWTRTDVKSYVDSREVVFEFADGSVKRIPLPGDKMLVAVAPYIRQTHQ